MEKKNKITTGIGYSPLTERVFMGRQNPEKGMWVGNDKKDITQEFIATMFAYVSENTSRTISTGKDKNMFINIKLNADSLEKWIKKLNKELEKLTTKKETV